MKICFIIPYFGQSFPAYFKYFLHSAKFNQSIDFLIFTNIKSDYKNTPNIKYIDFDIHDFNTLATKKLGLEIDIDENYPYKLCDFKPAYGVIFEDYLKKYHYWGHCDIDIIFGNLRKFIKSLIPDYDIVSTRQEFFSGFFALYRNTYLINYQFKTSRNWKSVFSEQSKYCGFDECNFLFSQLLLGEDIYTLNNEVESMTYILKRSNNIRTHFKTICHEFLPGNQYNDSLKLFEGNLTSIETDQEYPFVHLYNVKKYEHYQYLDFSENEPLYIDRFSISGIKHLGNHCVHVLMNSELVLMNDKISINSENEEVVLGNSILCTYNRLSKAVIKLFKTPMKCNNILKIVANENHCDIEKLNIQNKNLTQILLYGINKQLLRICDLTKYEEIIKKTDQNAIQK